MLMWKNVITFGRLVIQRLVGVWLTIRINFLQNPRNEAEERSEGTEISSSL